MCVGFRFHAIGKHVFRWHRTGVRRRVRTFTLGGFLPLMLLSVHGWLLLLEAFLLRTRMLLRRQQHFLVRMLLGRSKLVLARAVVEARERIVVRSGGRRLSLSTRGDMVPGTCTILIGARRHRRRRGRRNAYSAQGLRSQLAGDIVHSAHLCAVTGPEFPAARPSVRHAPLITDEDTKSLLPAL